MEVGDGGLPSDEMGSRICLFIILLLLDLIKKFINFKCNYYYYYYYYYYFVLRGWGHGAVKENGPGPISL